MGVRIPHPPPIVPPEAKIALKRLREAGYSVSLYYMELLVEDIMQIVRWLRFPVGFARKTVFSKPAIFLYLIVVALAASYGFGILIFGNPEPARCFYVGRPGQSGPIICIPQHSTAW